MKKISKFIFAFIFVFTLVGCNTNQTAYQQKTSPQNPYITLNALPDIESVQNIQLMKNQKPFKSVLT